MYRSNLKLCQETGTTIFPILQVRDLRLREIRLANLPTVPQLFAGKSEDWNQVTCLGARALHQHITHTQGVRSNRVMQAIETCYSSSYIHSLHFGTVLSRCKERQG